MMPAFPVLSVAFGVWLVNHLAPKSGPGVLAGFETLAEVAGDIENALISGCLLGRLSVTGPSAFAGSGPGVDHQPVGSAAEL